MLHESNFSIKNDRTKPTWNQKSGNDGVGGKKSFFFPFFSLPHIIKTSRVSLVSTFDFVAGRRSQERRARSVKHTQQLHPSSSSEKSIIN